VNRDLPTLLFVYGTLRAGSTIAAARQLHAAATRVGTGSIAARLLDLGAYPGAVPSADTSTRVPGELWAIAAEHATRVLAALDEYEGCRPSDGAPPLFWREVVDVVRADGQTRRAWAYFYARPLGGRGATLRTSTWRRPA
jgi:gamma-glutamylcyclotransferase (GGCT)/AIG2-like uncharacterized protein YtfP